jgi:hypothetical protein
VEKIVPWLEKLEKITKHDYGVRACLTKWHSGRFLAHVEPDRFAKDGKDPNVFE